MTRRTCHNADEMESWVTYLRSLRCDFPITVSWKKGKDRSHDQNALAFKWQKEIAEQRGDMDASEVRAYVKLNHGLKIIHAENEEFREQWNRLIRGRFTYEELLDLMVPPHDYPITRLMTTKQMSRYLDAIYNEFSAQGIKLTLPDVM